MKRCTMLRWFFRCLAVALGLGQFILGRNTVGPDSRSYLELARAILRHDWAMTINAYWSALYPWMLAAMIGIFKPSLRWEFPAAHALSLPLLLVCMASFEFFWFALLQFRESVSVRLLPSSSPIPPAQMWVLGYSMFIWLTVGDLLLPINPDMYLFAIILLAAGLLLRIELAAGARASLYIWFGICLGVGYLVKAIFFPMAFVFLAMMIAVSPRPWANHKRYFALTLLIFTLLVSPQIALLSHAKGRPTFSDTGKLAFAWYTYGLPLRNWQGQPAGSGTPAHPTRKLYDHPAVYEFNGPIQASYPPWQDPSYWNEGLSPAFKFGTVARHALRGTIELGLILLQPRLWAIGIFLILLGCVPRETFKGIAAYWHLIAITAAVSGLYALTLMQSRYLAPWELLFWGAVLAGVRLRRSTAPLSLWVTALVSLGMVASLARLEYGESIHGFHNDGSAEYLTAEGLKQMGLRPGEKVGAIGFDNDAHWAYLARLNVVAEINTDETCLFWSEPPEIQTQILEKLAQAGAGVVVANMGGGIRTTSRAVPIDLGKCALGAGSAWLPVPGTPNRAFFLTARREN